MRTRVAEWLANWADAPLGTTRLVLAAIISLTITLGVIGFVSIGFWEVVTTAIQLAEMDKLNAVNLKVREQQVRGLHADIAGVQCARR